MNDPLLKRILPLFFLVAAICLAINAYLMLSGIFSNFEISDWWMSYVFLIPVTAGGLYFITRSYTKSRKITSIGKNYIAYTVIKMVLSMAFLLPWLLNKDASSKPMVAQFFCIFFPFLLVETILLVRLLNTPLGEKKENEKNQ